jgi:L-ascorbate metabolism protein UlaG (beta-lactamase superfamily)
MNHGGGANLPFGHVKLTPAVHSSVLPDGTYGGNPAGFLLTLGGQRLYFACDTALFGDMKFIGAAGLDLAVVPIGDLYTMGPEDSIQALQLLSPQNAAPCHYNTWPPIAQDAQAWARRVSEQTTAKPHIPQPGETFTL